MKTEKHFLMKFTEIEKRVILYNLLFKFRRAHRAPFEKLEQNWKWGKLLFNDVDKVNLFTYLQKLHTLCINIKRKGNLCIAEVFTMTINLDDDNWTLFLIE